MNTSTLIVGLFLALNAHLSFGAVPVGAREVIQLEDGTAIQVQEFPGASKWAVLKNLFTSSTVVVQCPGTHDFTVFTGRTVPDIRESYARHDRAWCGWDRFMGRHTDTCIAPISPYGATFVAVAKPKSRLSLGGGGGGLESLSSPHACTMDREEVFSMPRFLAAVVGAFLFTAAPQLSESTPFRLAGGSLAFTALSSVVVLFVLYRSIPHKRSFLLGSALFGSTVAAGMRFIFGTWLPSVAQLARNPAVIGYAGLSALMGLALTYYYNDTSNRKINTILRVALQLSGLGMVAGSTSSVEGAAAAVIALLGSKLAPLVSQEHGVMPALRRAKASVQKDIQESIKPSLGGGNGVGVSHRHVEVETIPSRHHITAAPHAIRTPPVTAMGHPRVEVGSVPPFLADAPPGAPVSPLVHRGLVLNVDTGKTIQMGKATYNKLLDSGYVVDTISGTITPPPSGASVKTERRRSSGSGGRRRSKSRG